MTTPTQTITLPVLDADGARVGEEQVAIEPLGDDFYRLTVSPRFVDGVAAADEIALDPDVSSGFEVTKRGGNLCVRFSFSPEDADAVLGEGGDRLRADIEGLGGCLDAQTARSLIYTIPVEAGFGTVEAIFGRATEELAGTRWRFTNVYDRETNQPLDWWC